MRKIAKGIEDQKKRGVENGEPYMSEEVNRTDDGGIEQA